MINQINECSPYENPQNSINKQLEVIGRLREAGRAQRKGIISEFLWTCAGADKELLRMCPHDQSKVSGIGGSILLTALFSALGVTYLCHATFMNICLSVVVGVISGFLVFNLDRMIINTMYVEGNGKISIKSLASSTPRLLVSIFFSIVIALPVQLQIFKPSIENIRNEKISAQVESSLREYSEMEKSKINELSIKIDSLQLQLTAELPEKYSKALLGKGRKAQAIEHDIISLSLLRDSLLNRLETVLIPQKEADFIKKNNAEPFGLSSQIETLYGKLSYTESALNCFILFFFILIGITPVWTKMLTSNGLYELYTEHELYYQNMLYRINKVAKDEKERI